MLQSKPDSQVKDRWHWTYTDGRLKNMKKSKTKDQVYTTLA
jgi:hypothetical protein